MARLKIFPRFDPRLASDLRLHRRTIALGLFCVLVSSLLDAAVYPLINQAITSIQEAAPRASSQQQLIEDRKEELRPQAQALARELSLKEEDTLDILSNEAEKDRLASQSTLPHRVAERLKVPQERVATILKGTENLAGGNLSAVRRLGVYSLLVIAVFAIKYWFTRGQALYLSKAAASLSADLRKRLFDKLQRLPVSYFGNKRVGGIQSVLTNDVGMYQSAVGIVRDSIDAPIRSVIAFAWVLYAQWQLALVTMIFLPIMAVVIQRNSRKMKVAQSAAQDDLAELAATTNESLQGQRVIKAFAAEGRMRNLYDGLVDRSLDSQVFAAARQASLRPLVELIGASALAVIIFVCGVLAYEGGLKLGAIASLLLALDRINQGFRSLGGVANTYSQVQAASDRIHREILGVPDAPDAGGGTRLEVIHGRIEFDRVSFSYPDGTEALRKVSFTLEPGTSLALVGPSGAGKSTVADLLLRFYDPTEGEIRLDGVPLKALDPSWLRAHIGVVPQQTFLFAGSIAENVRLGKEDASNAQVQEALRQAHAENFVSTMPQRADSHLGEGGAGLSGGQRQRVAIARALVRDPAILLLDEATSALDAESERAVTEALDEAMQTRTTLFIAHRLTTAARADRILMMSRGEILESGSHTELMAANGPYAGLFRAFSGGVLE
ncbi:ABC transporter ATP-binding protein [soil metagenome]